MPKKTSEPVDLMAALQASIPGRAAIVYRINTRYEDADLTVNDLKLIDGQLTIDGMDPDQWAEAMYGPEGGE